MALKLNITDLRIFQSFHLSLLTKINGQSGQIKLPLSKKDGPQTQYYRFKNIPIIPPVSTDKNQWAKWTDKTALIKKGLAFKLNLSGL